MEKSKLTILIFASIMAIIFVIVQHQVMLSDWYVYGNIFWNKFLGELNIKIRNQDLRSYTSCEIGIRIKRVKSIKG